MKKAFSLFVSTVLAATFFVLAPATAGSAASVKVGTLAYAGGLLSGDTVSVTASGTSNSATLSYQWYNNDVAIDGATTNSLTLTADDLGDTIYVAVTASKVAYDSQTVNAPELVVGALNVLQAPNLVDTSLATTEYAQLSAAKVFPAPDSTTYDWYIDGTLHLEDGQDHHLIHASDLGVTFSAKVNFTKANYETVTVTTDSTAPITALFGDRLAPTVNGIAGVGSTLTAQAFDDGAVDFDASYQWYVGGKKVKGAVNPSYKPVKKDAGKKLSVKVTYTAPLFESRTFTVKVADKILTQKTKLTWFVSAYDAYADCEVDSVKQECARGSDSYSGQVQLTSRRAKNPDTGELEWSRATFKIKYNVDPSKVISYRVHQRGNDGIDSATTLMVCANDHDKTTTVTGYYWVGPWCAPDGKSFGRWHVWMNSSDADVYALKAYLEIKYYG